MQEGRESVCELQDTDGRHDGCEAGEIWDGGPNDEGDGPVEGDEADPEVFPCFLGEGRGAEEFDGDVIVEDYEAGHAISTPVS